MLDTILGTRQQLVEQMLKTQEAALRIVFQLPNVLTSYFGVSTLSDPELSADGQTVQYKLGEIAGLTISPWDNSIMLSDLRGERSPKRIELNVEGAYFDQDTTLAMLGYFELLKRTGVSENPDAWTQELNAASSGAARV